jgi:DNA invertase Pin-like site-specific DNA recombinase
LNKEQVREIRRKYNPHVYGKKRLAIEYGVSVSVIYRIIKGVMWKTT